MNGGSDLATPRILVAGGGAVGRMVADAAAAGGADVTIVSRSAGARGTRTGRPVWTWNDLAASALPEGLFQIVLVAVKAMDTPDVAARLARLPAARGACLVSLQNGLGNEEVLEVACPGNPVASGALTASVERVDASAAGGGPDVRRRTRGGVVLAPWRGQAGPDGDRARAALDPLARALEAGGLPARVWPARGSAAVSGRDLKWSKLLLNIAGNGLAAATGLLPDRLAADPAALSFELRLLREARRVGEAEGARWADLPGFPVRTLVGSLALPDVLLRPLLGPRLAGGRGGKPPSLWLDVEAGRPLEADALYGAVVRLARRHAISTPAHDALLRALAARTSDPDRRPVPLPVILAWASGNHP